MVKNLPANTGYMALPWSRKIPQVPEQLSPWATTTGALHSLEPMLYNKRAIAIRSPHNNEDPVQPKTNK